MNFSLLDHPLFSFIPLLARIAGPRCRVRVSCVVLLLVSGDHLPLRDVQPPSVHKAFCELAFCLPGRDLELGRVDYFVGFFAAPWREKVGLEGTCWELLPSAGLPSICTVFP